MRVHNCVLCVIKDCADPSRPPRPPPPRPPLPQLFAVRAAWQAAAPDVSTLHELLCVAALAAAYALPLCMVHAKEVRAAGRGPLLEPCHVPPDPWLRPAAWPA